jgi:hypothetical protein
MKIYFYVRLKIKKIKVSFLRSSASETVETDSIPETCEASHLQGQRILYHFSKEKICVAYSACKGMGSFSARKKISTKLYSCKLYLHVLKRRPFKNIFKNFDGR